MKTPTLSQFKRFCKTNGRLALAVVEAQALAQVTRAKVDAYIAPVLAAAALRDEDGALITNAQQVYLCADDAACSAFFAACDAAHRAAGYDMPPGYNPALVAQSMLIDAENALIDAGCKLLGVERCLVDGENRADMLKLLLGACVPNTR